MAYRGRAPTPIAIDLRYKVVDVPDAIDRIILHHGPAAICAALAPMLTPQRIQRIDAALDNRLASVITCVEDTYDPLNAAATIRTTEALGLQELHVIEAGNRFSAAGGVTKGAHRWIDLVRWPRAEDAIQALRVRGFRVFATAPNAALSIDLRTPSSGVLRTPARPGLSIDLVDVTTPIAVMFGNEHQGLSAAAIASCDGNLSVPMYGFTESYNLSVSVGVAMNRIAARRRQHLGVTGDLDAARRDMLRARWFALRIRGVVGVIERTLGGGRAAAL